MRYSKKVVYNVSMYMGNTSFGTKSTNYSINSDSSASQKTTKINQLSLGLYRAVKDIEGRDDSHLFVTLIADLSWDISNLIKLNYLTGAIFHKNITRENVNNQLTLCNITSPDTQAMMWFDTTYGFRQMNTFNTWLRISYLKKTNIKSYLIGYFNIDSDKMNCLTDDNSWLVKLSKSSLFLMNEKFKESCAESECTSIELTMLQWGGKSVTNMIGKVVLVSHNLGIEHQYL